MSDTRPEAEWLRKARADYLASAEQKISDLRQAIDNLSAQPSDMAARQRLHTLLHNLIGSGASYGFPAISVIARRLSSALKRAKDERTIVQSGLIDLLNAGLEDLRQAFEEASA